MTPRLIKAVLASHITFSLGWLGAVSVFIALAITGLTTHDAQLARSCILAMNISAWAIIVPFCLISFLTGIIQALGTKWGLFRHYWIVVKLFLTIISTILLLLHMQPITDLAYTAAGTAFTVSQSASQLIQLIAKAGGAIVVLIAITTISVYKPWGKLQSARQVKKWQAVENKTGRPWSFYAKLIVTALLIILVIMHIVSGMHAH